jgi:hypothetical protein
VCTVDFIVGWSIDVGGWCHISEGVEEVLQEKRCLGIVQWKIRRSQGDEMKVDKMGYLIS